LFDERTITHAGDFSVREIKSAAVPVYQVHKNK